MKIAIIRYNAGNIKSVSNGLFRLGVEHVITDNIDEIRSADKVIFPGVGEASTTMRYLKERKMDILIKELKQPVLGICLGMQLMCRYSDEGDTNCLGIFDLTVKKFDVDLKIPHMGWNKLVNTSGLLMANNIEGEYMYFVHGFYVPSNGETIAETNYDVPFSAAIQKGNFFATQFHPEKSEKAGERLMENFLNL